MVAVTRKGGLAAQRWPCIARWLPCVGRTMVSVSHNGFRVFHTGCRVYLRRLPWRLNNGCRFPHTTGAVYFTMVAVCRTMELPCVAQWLLCVSQLLSCVSHWFPCGSQWLPCPTMVAVCLTRKGYHRVYTSKGYRARFWGGVIIWLGGRRRHVLLQFCLGGSHSTEGGEGMAAEGKHETRERCGLEFVCLTHGLMIDCYYSGAFHVSLRTEPKGNEMRENITREREINVVTTGRSE
ncbi:unnamed protein product [Laminaria digitata]